MKTGTAVLIGAGVLAGGVGLAWWARSKKGKGTPAKGKKGKGTPAKGKSGAAPTRTTPKSMQNPPKTASRPAVSEKVFTLSAAEAKTMACELRAANNVEEVEAVLDVLRRKIDASGATMVDLRSSGLTRAKVPVAQFDKEAAEIVRQMRLLPRFMWGVARSRITTALSSLPACDAPMQQWEVMFGEASGVQAAVRPPPYTLLQGIGPLRG